MEQATKRYQSITESTGFMLAVTTLGGFLNSYTYATRDGVFANMHTGNMTRLGISLADGAPRRAVLPRIRDRAAYAEHVYSTILAARVRMPGV